jgi:hypothetical protein
MRVGARLALGLLVVAGVALASDPLVVLPNGRLDSLHAERYDLPARFLVRQVDISQAAASAPALGTPDRPAVLTEADTPAGTAIAAGDWVYATTIEERSPDAADPGVYVVELAEDGRVVGDVDLEKNVSDPALRQGARVSFDIGPSLPDDPLFLVGVLLPQAASAPIPLTSAVDASLNYVWQDASGRSNPSLSTKVGVPLTLRAVNGDGTAIHALELLDAGGNVVAGPTRDVSNRGDAQDLPWTPEKAGSYHYQCRYHPTMTGSLQVNP